MCHLTLKPRDTADIAAAGLPTGAVTGKTEPVFVYISRVFIVLVHFVVKKTNQKTCQPPDSVCI